MQDIAINPIYLLFGTIAIKPNRKSKEYQKCYLKEKEKIEVERTDLKNTILDLQKYKEQALECLKHYS
ncbi:MAG: hypothetical protein AABX80_00375 [Nanoarchaeota archaeon]